MSAFTSSGYRIQPIADGFLLACHPKDEESDGRNLLKVDGEGRVLWAKTYNTVYWGFDTKPNGETLLAGHTRKSNLSKNWDAELTVVDSAGKTLWTKFFGQPRGYDGRWIHDEVWGALDTRRGLVGGGGNGRRDPVVRETGTPIRSLRTMEGLSDQDRWEGKVGVGRCLRFAGRDWAGEDACITVDGGGWWPMIAARSDSQRYRLFCP